MASEIADHAKAEDLLVKVGGPLHIGNVQRGFENSFGFWMHISLLAERAGHRRLFKLDGGPIPKDAEQLVKFRSRPDRLEFGIALQPCGVAPTRAECAPERVHR